MRSDSPSETAILVARSVLLASRHEDLQKLVANGEMEILEAILAEVSGGEWLRFAIKRRWARKLLFGLERNLLPGIIAHYLVRKRRIELVVREALRAGISQVVVAGAGFDTLAWRLREEFPEVCFLELDHPATLNVKSKALGPAPNVQFCPVDLSSEALLERVRSCPVYSPRRPAIVVAEGLTMYLSAERVKALLCDVAVLAGKGGRTVFTFMEEDADGSISFRGASPLVARWLHWRSEPFHWGISRVALPGYLDECGLGNCVIVDDGDLRAQILVPRGLEKLPLARGECLCLASPN